MRVLMLLYNQVGKGTYWRALHLARNLADRGHRLTVLATSRDRRLRFGFRTDTRSDVSLVEAPDMLWQGLRAGWDLWGTLRRILWVDGEKFDLIHGFESRPAVILPALYGQRRKGTRLVLDWCDWFGRGGSVEERPNRLLRFLLRPVETLFEERFRQYSDGTTVINGELRRRAITLGVTPETVLLLPNGSNVDEIRPVPQEEARRALGWQRDVQIIGYVGAIFHRDAELMAQAFDRVHSAMPSTRLLLIGYCNVSLEGLVNTPDAVWHTGRVEYNKINRYLGACDVCWLTMQDSGANRGRSPLKVKDYMAAGRPVVTTAVGDVAELVRRGGFGLVAPDEPDVLADQTLVMLRDPEQRQEMGRRARQIAEDDFRWERMAERLEQFYERILELET
jgi:glycosyltransferase involved in cell wall biosynthesis